MAAAVLIWGLAAMEGSIAFFLRPSEVKESYIGKRIRVGGIVSSFDRERFPYKFLLDDQATSIQVIYKGVLPDLFREEQVVLAEGVLQKDKILWADTVLAKHDEEYVPYGMK